MTAEAVSERAPRAATGEGLRKSTILGGFAVLFLVTACLGAGLGALPISVTHQLAILADGAGLGRLADFSKAEEIVYLHVRLPRVVLGALAGACLAGAGASLQGLFRNPLADPGLIGVSGGAALAVVAVIVGAGTLGTFLGAETVYFLRPVAAFLGGLAAVLLVYTIASRGGFVDVPTMLLAGVAVNAIAGAGIGYAIFASADQELRDINFWMLGSLAAATWDQVMWVACLAAGPLFLLLRLSHALNAFLLGEQEASYLGFDADKVKRIILFSAALMTGIIVAFTGVIGFVGLVVPHLIRLAFGPDHRLLIPASFLLGASLLVGADIAARLLVLPAELPIGIVTSLVGGPFFFWLLMRRRGGLMNA